MEAQLQKLKVAELKELLSKHNLPQTGKKDDLVKRLVENNVGPEGQEEEELVDLDSELVGVEESGTGDDNGETAAEPVQEVAATEVEAAPTTDSDSTAAATSTLTPDQQAMKARAERFGVPFNPNAAPTQRAKPAAASKATAGAKESSGGDEKSASAESSKPKQKAGAIDAAPLGVSEEVLAKRAAKFGIPEKKVEEKKEKAKENGAKDKGDAAVKKPASAAKPPAEITPEMAEKLAAEEEKKRKRAEKFGTGKPVAAATTTTTDAATNGSEEPDAKKAKA